jgi:hypothetical protein
MNNQLLIKLKQDLLALEAKEKSLGQKIDSKRRSKNIGKLMSLCLLLGAGVASSHDSLAGMLLLIGFIGLFIWLPGSRAVFKVNKELEAVSGEILETKEKIIVAESS